jgi:dihydroflavonol-4-reductase
MTEPPKRVLVLGATGHIGQAVVRHALERGRKVTALTRRFDPEALRGLDVKIVQVDGELSSLADLAAGHDLLVDAAGPYPLTPGIPGGAQWQAQVDGAVRRMEHVIDVVRRCGVRLAYVSSSTTLPRDELGLRAAAAVWRRSVSPYFEAKVAMEHIVVAAAREGLPAVIVNPATFLGPWEFRPVEGSFVRLVLERRLPMVLNETTCVIDVREVAVGIDRALAHELYGCPIPLAGYDIDWPELVMLTAQLAGLPWEPVFSLPSDVVSAWVFWMQTAHMAAGLTPPAALDFVPLIADTLPMGRSTEQIALGVTVRPLEETLRDAIAFHRTRHSV